MRQAKLSELLDISIGRTPSRNEPDYWGDGHRWVSIRDLNSKIITETKEQITDLALKASRFKVVKKGTLLFSFKLTIGKMAFAGRDLYTNEAIAAFSIKDERTLESNFLYYALQSATYGGSNQAVMGKTLNLKSLAEIKIPLPPLDDQIRIAHLLGTVEGMIAQRKQHLKSLDDLLKSVFLGMFGDPVRNEGGWRTEQLGHIASIERGRFSPRPRDDPRYFGGEYPFVQTGDITRSRGRLKKFTQTLNELGIKVSKEFKVGTIVIAIVGATIGETALLEIATYAPDSVIGITPNMTDAREAIFIEYVLRFWKPVLRAKAPEAARANINIETLRPLEIIMPSDRAVFSEVVIKVERLKTAYQNSLTDLEALYGALSQRAFKGELDLSRLPLPYIQGEEEHDVASEPLPPRAEQRLTVTLSDTDNLLTALESPEAREGLIAQWLEAYRSQLNRTPFSVHHFLEAAHARLAELRPDSDLELGANDYEHIKSWVFEALATGTLTQAFDDAGNRIEIKAALA